LKRLAGRAEQPRTAGTDGAGSAKSVLHKLDVAEFFADRLIVTRIEEAKRWDNLENTRWNSMKRLIKAGHSKCLEKKNS
jgi:hypothetical protein